MVLQIFNPLAADTDTIDGNKIGELARVTSFRYKKYWQKIGDFEIVAPASQADVSLISEDVLLLYDGDWLIVSGIKTDATNVTITGTDLKGYLNQRITLYETEQDTGAQGYDVCTGTTETVLKHYVENNANNPTDAYRRIPGLTIAANQGRGLASDSYMARLQNLADVCTEICENAEVGYTLEADYANNQYVFDIVPQTDKTEDQIARDRIVFSVRRGNVIALSGERSADRYRNVFYATKANGSLAADALTKQVLRSGVETPPGGPFRREVQVNVSTDTVADIDVYARHEAENYVMADSYTVEAGAAGEYRNDYDIGDLVTVRDRYNAGHDKVITAAEKNYSGSDRQLRLTFGDPKKKLISGINENVERAVYDIKKIVIDKAGKEDVQSAVNAQDTLSELMTNALGLYKTVETSDDGSSVYYMHDQPLLADSLEIWKFASGAFAASTDGGQTWNSGITAAGSAIIKAVESTKIVTNVQDDLNGKINAINTQMSKIEMNADSIDAKVQNIVENGVDKVITETGASLDAEGLHVTKTGEEMETRIDFSGVHVERDNTAILTADNNGVNAENVMVREYLTIGTNSRFEDYGDNRTGCYYIGG